MWGLFGCFFFVVGLFFFPIAKVQVGENTAGIKVLLRGFHVSFLGVVMVVEGVVLGIKQFAVGFTKILGILFCLVDSKRFRLFSFVLVTIK